MIPNRIRRFNEEGERNNLQIFYFSMFRFSIWCFQTGPVREKTRSGIGWAVEPIAADVASPPRPLRVARRHSERAARSGPAETMPGRRLVQGRARSLNFTRSLCSDLVPSTV